MKLCAKEDCGWAAAWPSSYCFQHRREAVEALRTGEPKKLGRPPKPKRREPRYVRLSPEGCDAFCDQADGWIVSCPNVVVWRAPEGDPLGPLSYCGFHFLERVAAVAPASLTSSSSGAGEASGVAAPASRPERGRLTAAPRRGPLNE